MRSQCCKYQSIPPVSKSERCVLEIMLAVSRSLPSLQRLALLYYTQLLFNISRLNESQQHKLHIIERCSGCVMCDGGKQSR